MDTLKRHILGISDTRLSDSRITPTPNKVFHYSENINPKHENEMGIILNSDIGNSRQADQSIDEPKTT